MSDHDSETATEPGQFLSDWDVRRGNGRPKSAEDAVERRLEQEGSYCDSAEERLQIVTSGVISMMGRLVHQLHLSGKLNDQEVVAVLGGDFRQATPDEVVAYAAPRPSGPGRR